MDSEHWEPTTLGAEVDLLTGFPFPSSFYTDSCNGIPLLRGDNIAQGHLRWDGLKRWPQEKLSGLSAYQLQAGDIVLAMDRPWIEAGLKYAAIGLSDLPCLLVQRVARLRGSQKLSTRFLKYVISSQKFTNHVLAVQTGTAIPHISGEQIKEFIFLRPPIEEQEAIVEILGALDDRIELNRRMNQTIEAVARAIFDSWHRTLESETSSDVDRMPVKWIRGALGDIATNHRRTLDSSLIPPDTPYIGLEHMPRRSIALSDWSSASSIQSSKFQFQKGEILFGKLRPYFHKVGVAALDGVCSTDILVISPKIKSYWGWVAFTLSSNEFVQYTDRASAGTKMPRTNWADMSRFELAIPPEGSALAFTKIVEPMVHRIMANIFESLTLATLRDALIPKLLSGEVRVKRAERIVGNTV